MVDGDSRSHLCVLIVGTVRDDLVRGLSGLAAEYEAVIVRCSDVYVAVAECVTLHGASFLAVGSLRELARENGRFFAVAARNAGTCCALVDREGSLDRDGILMAIRMGIPVAAGMDQIKSVFENWLGIGGSGFGPSALVAEEYQASEAELSALLGQDADG